MKQLIFSILAVFLLSGISFAQENPLTNNVSAKFMPGIMVESGVGAAMDMILLPKKLSFPIKPALNLGLSSRMISEQTGEDLAMHAGAQLCVYEAICAGRGYDFQEQEQRWLFNIESIGLYGLIVQK